jgi:GNAT superfamily N-acetyltransferase
MSTKRIARVRWLENHVGSKMAQTSRVAEISQQCLGTDGMTVDDVRAFLGRTNTIPKVILRHRHVLGYMFYTLSKHDVIINSMAIDPAEQRKGYGTTLIKALQHVLRLSHRRRGIVIVTMVSKRLSGAQDFFTQQGFVCVRTVHKGTPDEKYVFKYTEIDTVTARVETVSRWTD